MAHAHRDGSSSVEVSQTATPIEANRAPNGPRSSLRLAARTRGDAHAVKQDFHRNLIHSLPCIHNSGWQFELRDPKAGRPSTEKCELGRCLQ